MIVICGSAQLFFLICTIVYRENNVMKLSQGFPFLMMLSLAGLIAMVSSAFYRPSNDVFCYLSTPLTMVPMQFMLAVVFGRLRRIITIMGPLMGYTNMRKDRRAMKQGFRKWKNVMMERYSNSQSTENRGSKFSSKLSSQNSDDGGTPSQDDNKAPARKRKLGMRQASSFVPKSAAAIRQQFTIHELWVMIFLATLPMIIIGVFRAGFSPQNRTLHLNEDESEGRCKTFWLCWAGQRIAWWILLTFFDCDSLIHGLQMNVLARRATRHLILLRLVFFSLPFWLTFIKFKSEFCFCRTCMGGAYLLLTLFGASYFTDQKSFRLYSTRPILFPP